MEIKSIEIQDTSGELINRKWRGGSTHSVVRSWFDEDENMSRRLNVSPANLRMSTVFGRQAHSTYVAYLAYNGTNSTSSRIFRNIVAQETGVVDVSAAPVLSYSPNGLEMPAKEDLDDVVIDIKLHTGQADILEYREGSLSRGGKSYGIKAVHSYPATVTTLPNAEQNTVYFDGWYTYDFITFRDLETGVSEVVADMYYSFEGLVFKASISGKFYALGEIGNRSLYVKPVEDQDQDQQGDQDTDEEDFIKQSSSVQDTDIEYLDLIMNLKNSDGVGDAYNHAYLETQLLITDEIRDAITKEILCAATCKDGVGSTLGAWQKLTLKRQAAAIMFYNELFRNAQVIIESSRKMCNLNSCE